MMALKWMSHRYVLAAFSAFFLYILSASLRGVSNLQSSLHLHLGGVTAHNEYAYIANATTQELQASYDEAFNISDFGTMGERVSEFSSLAHSTVADPTIDRAPLLALLRKYFPWWQPRPATYTPWQHSASDPLGTTGIVICVGSSNLIYAMHTVLSLRNVLHSKLPIQIAYGGDSDLSFSDRVAITDLGSDIETLNVRDYFDEEIAGLHDGGWAMKPFAMLASRFQKTIVLDADAVFVRSPDQLFQTEPGLVETGTLFWHDRAFDAKPEGRHAWIRDVMGHRQPSAMLNQSLFWQKGIFHEMDSAALCMDKGRPNVFMSLLFSCWMNTRRVRDEITYQHVHGDKETFWLASELSYSPYHFHPFYAGVIGVPKVLPQPEDTPTLETSPDGEASPELRSTPSGDAPLGSEIYLTPDLQPTNPYEVCSAQALHLDHLGRPFWFNGSLRKNKSLVGQSLPKLRELLSSSADVFSGELNEKIKTDIQEIAEQARLGIFTHWMPGTADWEAMPGWSMTNVECCMISSTTKTGPARELDAVTKEILDNTLEYARETDNKFYGFNRANVTVPVGIAS